MHIKDAPLLLDMKLGEKVAAYTHMITVPRKLNTLPNCHSKRARAAMEIKVWKDDLNNTIITNMNALQCLDH